jgi:hypothetical protein
MCSPSGRGAGSLGRMSRSEVYFSVDIEADGPIPGPFSMLSVGIAVAGRLQDGEFTAADPDRQTFYRELAPISTEHVPEALAVSGLDRAALVDSGADPVDAMTDLANWIGETADGGRPVAVAYPAVFDWMWLYWYFVRFTGSCPFGHSGVLDMKTLFAVKAGVPLSKAVKRLMPPELHSRRPHTHHALDDAKEQADLFASLTVWAP